MRKQTYPIVATPAQAKAGLRGINREMRLYLIPCGSGFTCYGFDVLHRKTAALATFAGRPDLAPPARKGTLKAWLAYKAASAAAVAHHKATGERATFELEPRLVGLEGKRVEVTSRGGHKRRFWVGRSMGWTPCHLEIARRDSHGGGAAYLNPGDKISVVANAR